jgi:proteasome lid subunit RPN8/RPN11
MGAFVLALLLAADCGDLCRGEAVAHYARLFAEAGYGRMPHERAGFLVRETDTTTLTIAPFPLSGFAHARHRGAVPPNAIAVVHTHPSSSSHWPSSHDVSEARRLRMPVLVIAREGITAAMPDGSIVELEGRQWLTSAARTPGLASGTGRGPHVRHTSLRR